MQRASQQVDLAASSLEQEAPAPARHPWL